MKLEVNVLYRTMEKTGDKLSILGFGAMRLPQLKKKIDEDRATAQIRSAIDSGVNYVDTAFGYHSGQSEPFLGRALKDGYRDRIHLATKLPHWIAHSRTDMDKLLKAQLHHLQTDRIDYYLVHNLHLKSWQRIRDLGVVDFLEKAKADGRIHHVGFSFHGSLLDFKAIIDDHDWEFCQIQYNILDVENQAGTKGLEYAASKGLGIIVMEPLRGGFITKRIPKEVQSVWNEAQNRKSPAEWALRWIWNRPEVTMLLSGMNDEKHIEENIRIASDTHPNSLSEPELNMIDKVRDTYLTLMKAGCTGCRYCMPCPAGVNIARCLDFLNTYSMGESRKRTQFLYTVIVGNVAGDTPGLASQCTACGQCLDKCPQKLNIPDLLCETAGAFENKLTRLMIRMGKIALGLKRRQTFRQVHRI